jgi:hypothetical protein
MFLTSPFIDQAISLADPAESSTQPFLSFT